MKNTLIAGAVFVRMIASITILFMIYFITTDVFANHKLPEIIDYSQLKGGCINNSKEMFEIGALGFNQAPEILNVIVYLKKRYKLQDAVETGTYQGNTSKALSMLFDKVYTIEVTENSYQNSQKSLASSDNIELIFGSSEQKLDELLPNLTNRRILFYLDAHWDQNWPILKELSAISKTHKDNCVIIIDDVQVPGYSSIAYDSHQGEALSYDYIKEVIGQVFTNHSVHYALPSDYNKRAKMILIPVSQ
jgi:predicted O-methyltransferase YrrM